MNTIISRAIGTLRIAVLSAFGVCTWPSATAHANPMAEDFDAILSPHLRSDKPGATILVTKDGRTLFRKAYGLADLERNIPLEPEMVMRLGSLISLRTSRSVSSRVLVSPIATPAIFYWAQSSRRFPVNTPISVSAPLVVSCTIRPPAR